MRVDAGPLDPTRFSSLRPPEKAGPPEARATTPAPPPGGEAAPPTPDRPRASPPPPEAAPRETAARAGATAPPARPTHLKETVTNSALEPRALLEASAQRVRERTVEARADLRRQASPAAAREGRETAAPTDAAAVLVRISSERRATVGDRGHAHGEERCPLCGLAASKYR